MGKWAKYSRNKYDEAFEKDPQFKNWIQRTPVNLLNEGKSEAYCKLCRSTIRAKRSDLLDHIATKSHISASKALPSNEQPRLTNFGFQTGGQKKNEKIMELKYSVSIACHTSINSVDHLGELTRELGKGSTLESMRLHRTKCSKLIERVIVPCLKADLKMDVGDSYFSLICDEATDITAKKMLAVCVRYFSTKERKMMTHLLGIVEVPVATSEKLYGAVISLLDQVGLRLNRLIALGTDGGANFCGQHNSLFAYLRDRHCPKLILVRCICHSLDKCASYASKALPTSLEFLIRESRNWFCHSSVRKLEYAELYKEMFGVEPTLLVKLAATRWLSFHGAVKTHLEQFAALKALFTKIAANASRRDQCPIADKLAGLHNEESLLLLTFLKPVLRSITQLNLLFQHSYADVTKVYRDLRTFVFALAQRVVKPEALRQTAGTGMLRKTELQALREALSKQDSLKSLEMVNLGEEFRKMTMDLENQNILSKDQVRTVRSYCANFLISLARELSERLPDCIEDIEKLRKLAPSQVFSNRGRPNFSDLPLHLIPHNFENDMLDEQWSALGALKYEDINREDETVETIDIVEFWYAIYSLKNGAGEQPFKEIAICAIALLSLPLSNAVVERIFSIMAIIKSKLRNKLSTSMLGAILFLRVYLKALGICCVQFTPTDAMLGRFNSSDMYAYVPAATARARATSSAGNAVEDEGSRVDDPDPEPAAAVNAGITFENDDDAILNVLELLEDNDINLLLS